MTQPTLVDVLNAIDVTSKKKLPRVERRSAPRALSDTSSLVVCRRSQGKIEACRGVIRNVSANGINLQTDRQFRAGTILVLAPLDVPGPSRLVADVVWCQAEGDGWVHGCRLENPLSAEELRSLAHPEAEEPEAPEDP